MRPLAPLRARERAIRTPALPIPTRTPTKPLRRRYGRGTPGALDKPGLELRVIPAWAGNTFASSASRFLG